MSKPGIQIDRTGVFIISYQLAGLCHALRLTVPNGLKPGNDTLAILTKLIADFNSISSGSCLRDMPTISESSSPVDILSLAETMRMTVLAFLSPEEIREHQRAVGFRAEGA